jgi:cyclic beta-1,2-glucan synthetase
MAMAAVGEHLVRRDERLVLLFEPPFDKSPLDPGYIKGYLPGLRENGGQFTHAAMWVLMAYATLKDHQSVAELLDMLNPVRRSDSEAGVQRYRVEPYVLASDVYSGGAVSQRGGWTWYTGAAGWFYRAILEYVLGVRISANSLSVAPCVPPGWDSFEVVIELPGVDYEVRMRRLTAGESEQLLLFDGAPVAGDTVPLVRDGRRHTVEIMVS